MACSLAYRGGQMLADHEVLRPPLLTDDGKFASTPGQRAEIHHYPD